MTRDQLAVAMERAGFAIVHENTKTVEYFHQELSRNLYLKRVAGDALASHTKPIVIHPDYVDEIESLRSVPGLTLGAGHDQPVDGALYYHNSTMRSFPQRIHTGRESIPYGIAIGVSSERSLVQLIALLSGNAGNLADDLERAADELQDLPLTDRAAIINARVGQGLFRTRVIAYWKTCAVTDVGEPRLLRASHIKPWRDADNRERLDGYNGLLLTPNLDQCFDQGLISFSDQGGLLISSRTDPSLLASLGISPYVRLRQLEAVHMAYLSWHRDRVFRK